MSAADLIRQILWATSLIITFPLKVHVSSIFPDFFSTLASRASFARIPVLSSFRKILLSLCLALCSFNTKRALNTSSRIDSLECPLASPPRSWCTLHCQNPPSCCRCHRPNACWLYLFSSKVPCLVQTS